MERMEPAGTDEKDYNAAKVFRDAMGWIDWARARQPFALVIDSFDAHEPWDAPPYYTEWYDPGYDGEGWTGFRKDNNGDDVCNKADAHITGAKTQTDPADPTKWEVVPELIGSGPFKLRSWRKGEDVVLEAHRGHWMPPKADGHIVRPATTSEAMIGMLERGELDMTNTVTFPVEAIARLRRLPTMDVLQSRSFKLWYLAVDHTKKPFDDPRFRQALDHAIDKQKFVNIALRGAAAAARNTPIAPVLKPWHNPNLPTVEFNIDRARDILKAAGYSWDRQGRLLFPA